MACQGPLVTVVGFHHSRGPEVEFWLGVDDDVDPVVENDWSLLPFMALSDGAHTSEQEFSFFSLKKTATTTKPATSLFGIACTRQIDARKLRNKPDDVTRSTVQKAVVVVTEEPQHFGQLREKLSVVTSAWFEQGDFSDIEILKTFQESLSNTLKTDDQQDQYLGLSLREMIHEFKYQTLVLLKCCLLQPKMLFFGSRCERLCMMQFSLISLIPGLLKALQDCADPALDTYETSLKKPTSLKTSDRSSLLAYMGLPLQVFGKGSMFGPYTPLQQLDLLADYGTKSYIVGSTNSLLLQQKDRYSNILINLDESTVSITSPSLRSALALTAADRRWVDFLTQTVNDTWDPENPTRPTTHGYTGSEEFIRLQFEEYIFALLSCTKYHLHLESHPLTSHKPPSSSTDASEAPETDPSLDFSPDFLASWRTTTSFALFTRQTIDSSLFDIVEPRHPCAGGLTIEDVQRRLAQQVAELHLDDRVKEGREALNKGLAVGQKKVSTAFNSLWADIEAMREAQRKKAAERGGSPPLRPIEGDLTSTEQHAQQQSGGTYASYLASRAPKTADIQASASVASQKAGAYLSSWGSWASDKKKAWEDKRSGGNTSGTSSPASDSRPSSSSPEKAGGLAPTGAFATTANPARLSAEERGVTRWSSLLKGNGTGREKENSSNKEERMASGRRN